MSHPLLTGRLAVRSAVAVVLLIAVAACVAGCQLFGAVVETTNGDDPIKAVYTPTSIPMVVMVENYNGSSPIDSENLARFIEAEITQNKIAPLVNSDALANLRDADPVAFHTMRIQDIAKAVGAKQILYIDKVMVDVDRPQASDMAHGSLSASARIVAADTGNSLWPSGTGAGMPFSVEVPYAPMSQSNQSELRSKLTRQMAHEIVNIFHDHQPDLEDESNSLQP
jgi:hypothetical protein